jgi:hypothetical protein
VSQPSHPWTAGASHLYTREFMQLAHEHLNPGGVFVQWMNVMFMDEELLRSLTATLLDVFPEVRVYRPDPSTLVFLASDLALNLESRVAETGIPLRTAPLHYARYGINNTEDLVAALVLDTAGAKSLAARARLITDDDNRIATSSVFEKGRGMTGETTGRVLASHDPWQRPQSLVYGSLREKLSFPYMIRRNGIFMLIDSSLTDRLRSMAQILGESADGEYARAFYYRMIRQTQRSTELLRLAIDQYPGYAPLREEYLRNFFAELARDQASPEVADVAKPLQGSSAALLAAARHAARAEWREVAVADTGLAEISWTDAWYPEALDLRVDWRTRMTTGEQTVRYGEESIPMIDRMAIMNPTLSLYGLRARAGFAARRPDVVIESVYNYARLAMHMARVDAITRDALRRDSRSLGEILDDAATMPGADAVRIGEVRQEVARLVPAS